MNWTKQICAVAVTTALGLGAVGAAPAAVAQPAPYNDQPKTSISTTNPPRGGTIKMNGKRFKPRERVLIRIHSQKAKTLKVVKANSRGSFKTRIKLPRKYKCKHTLIVRGKRSNLTVRTPIVIGKPSRCR